jgi:hypothetical protein
MVPMATEQQPDRDPIDQEIERVLADNPGLLERLKAVDGKRQRGELKTLPHEEALRRLGIDRKPT